MKKLCLVLGAGGLRGRAHLGVLKKLEEEKIRIHSVIGCSAGALVGAYYASCGLSIDEMTSRVSRLNAAKLIAFSVAMKKMGFLSRAALRYCGSIPEDLEILERSDFSRLFHGIEKLGILVFDLRKMRELFLHSGSENFGLTLAEAVRSSAATPLLFFPRRIRRKGHDFLLTDGGVSDPLPVKYAFSHAIGADLVLAVCVSRPAVAWIRTRRIRKRFGERLILVTPGGSLSGAIFSSAKKTEKLIESGANALDRPLMERLNRLLTSQFP